MMNTRVVLDYEPVADGGFFARAVLHLEGHGLSAAVSTDSSGRDRAAMAAVCSTAEHVTVVVRPGRHAEFIQVRHIFDRDSEGDLLIIRVGDIHALDRIRIRIDALIGPGAFVGEEADVGQIEVLAQIRTDEGVQLQRVTLPIRLSEARGGRVVPNITTTLLCQDGRRVQAC